MGSTRRSFTTEYKKNAVALVLHEGRSIAETARNIGVHEMTLGKWVKQARDNGDNPPDKNAQLTESEREELTRLRKENLDLRMQAEFAKKVATWFAKDQR